MEWNHPWECNFHEFGGNQLFSDNGGGYGDGETENMDVGKRAGIQLRNVP